MSQGKGSKGSKEPSLHESVNKLDVESAKQYKKHSQELDDTLNNSNDPTGNPIASSTLNTSQKKSSLKGDEPKTTLVADTFLSKNRLPRISICPAKYTPMLYTFRVPSYDHNSINRGKAQSPPFYLLLDSAIAVVWCLFSKATCPKPVGICQLQWALSFLEAIKNRRGEHPKDVDLCVNVIYDQLVDLYGDLIYELEMFHTGKPKKRKAKRSSRDVDEAEDFNKTPTEPDQLKDKKVGGLSLTDSYLERIYENAPFSVNYNDIINTSVKSTAAYSVDTTKSGKSINTQSRDKLVSFLSSWKQEQIGKIQTELQRLHSIENFIGNCEKGNFPGSMDDKQLTVLLEEKNKRNNTI